MTLWKKSRKMNSLSNHDLPPLLRAHLEAAVDWKRLRVFAMVAETGSFTRAGYNLNLSQSAVSRHISSLETALKLPLFHRHQDGIALTDAGANFYKEVRFCFDRLILALRRINEHRENPEGPLRITTTAAFGSGWLSSRMHKFHAQYPGVSVSLHLIDNTDLDIARGEADVAIRFQPQTQQRLIQRYLMTMRYHVFASRKYLDRYGIPRSASELGDYQVIAYGESDDSPIANVDWLLSAGRPPDCPLAPVLRINSVYGIYRAVRSGLGIAALPYYLCEEGTDLVEILPELTGPSFDVFFVYLEDLRHSRRISALRDFLVAEAAEFKANTENLPRQSN